MTGRTRHAPAPREAAPTSTASAPSSAGSLPVSDRKFAPPRPPRDLIPRPRLGEMLDGTDWRMALITGGPGTGKSVVAGEWLRSRGDAHRAWVTLDGDDDRPDRFWSRVEAALQLAAPDSFAGRLPLRRRDQRSANDLPFGDLLFHAASLDKRLVLVLDQLDQVKDPSIFADLTSLTEHLPTGMQLVFTSRTDPPLPLAQWRVRSWLTELRQHDLAFTPEESRSLFEVAGEHRLSDDDIDKLTAHTEGWIAALRLAILSMRDRPDPVAIATAFSGRNRMVADLLVTEVLERQPEALQQFLLRTSVVSHFDTDLCNALTDRSDSGEVLRTLEAQVCFVATDDERGSYRYHPLFAELLRLEHERRYPHERDELHRRAAAHLEARGDLVEAVRHHLAVGERERAFELAFGTAMERWDHDDIGAASAWLDVFPPEYIGGSIERMLVYGFALAVCGRLDEGVAWFERARHWLGTEEHPRERDLRHADALRLAQLTTGGSGDDGIECGRRVLAAVEGGLDLGLIAARVRPNLARAHLVVDDAEAAQAALEDDVPTDELGTLVLTPAVRARIALRRGCLTEALHQAGLATDGAAALGVPRHLGVVDALLARRGALVERHQLDAAIEVGEHIRRLMDGHQTLPLYHVLMRIDEARIANVGGRFDHGFALIDEARRRLGRPRPFADRLLDAAEARWRLETGELRHAEELIERLPSSVARQLLLARLDVARGRPEDAITTLLDAVPSNLRDELARRLLLGRARAKLGGRDPNDDLIAAVEVGLDEGFVTVFLEEGRPTARSARAAAEGIGTPAADRLAVALGARATATTSRPPRLVLSQREDAVLRYLPSRLTNKEIARECFMSVNTVKTHLKSIYSKLGASTRSEAIDEARRLDLL